MIPSTVKENDKVILKKDNNSKICKVVLGRKFNFCKEKFHLDGLVGQVYGASFKVEGDQLLKLSVQESNAVNSTIDDKNDVEGIDNELPSNRNLLDDQENQKLKKEEIEGLKSQGVSGETIIDQLVKNSATFENKTEFSKQKYLKRKAKKHLTIFTLLECNTRNLLDMYHSKGPTKICNLRMDSLAQILNGANVRVGGRFLVVDGCAGLVTGALLERLAGNGLVVNMYSGSAPARPAIELGYNFPEGHLSILKDFPLSHLNTLAPVAATLQQPQQQKVLQQQQSTEQQQLVQQQQNIPNQPNIASDDLKKDDDEKIESGDDDNAVEEKMDGDDDDVEGDDDDDKERNADDDTKFKKSSNRKVVPSSKRGKRNPETLEQRNERRMRRRKELNEVKEIIEEGKMDGLIICTRSDVTNLTTTLLTLLKPGRPLVVFSPYREPLLDCYVALRDSREAIMLKMAETWLRQYQILEDRSHPLVNMSGTGGCILTAIKILQ